jgi:3-hydroxybutyryl-CoA dehydrogenase
VLLLTISATFFIYCLSHIKLHPRKAMEKIFLGTVGLGLMGTSIATCLLAAGHKVTSLVKSMEEAPSARERIHHFLQQLQQEGLLKGDSAEAMQQHTITDEVALLSESEVVIETISENVDEKKKLFHQLETVLSPSAIIGTNTSAIPVSLLQKGLKYPQRLMGIHWGEPAHISRFMEVICGDETDIKNAEKIMQVAESWGKEPSLLRKDIRGFITNRIMYAMLREAFHLVDKGYATVEDIDRSLRNDLGYWITFAGPFRYMDLTGIPAYLAVMKDLLPELDNSTQPSPLIEKLVAAGAKGVTNANGFYPYTKESAEEWEKSFIDFSYDIRNLAEKYRKPKSER